jgi:hypothetical protein
LSDRQLVLPEHPYPIALAEIVDFQGLHFEIGRAQRTVGRRPRSNPNGGNNTRRIRLSFSLPRSWQTPAMEAFLASSNGDAAASNSIWTEVPTDDAEPFETRVRSARSKASGAIGGKPSASAAKVCKRSTSRRSDALCSKLAGSEDAEPGQNQEQRDVTILRSLPGVGRIVLATLLAEASEPSPARLPRAAKFVRSLR